MTPMGWEERPGQGMLRAKLQHRWPGSPGFRAESRAEEGPKTARRGREGAKASAGRKASDGKSGKAVTQVRVWGSRVPMHPPFKAFKVGP